MPTITYARGILDAQRITQELADSGLSLRTYALMCGKLTMYRDKKFFDRNMMTYSILRRQRFP